MLENHSRSTVIGDANAPYITKLAHTYAEATNYYGVTHPSQPNYVATITGQLDITRMNDAATNHYDWRNLVDQLEAHGRTWGAYMDTLPYAGYTGAIYPDAAAFPPSGAALYTNKHNPFVLMDDVLSSPARLANDQAVHEPGGGPQQPACARFRVDQPEPVQRHAWRRLRNGARSSRDAVPVRQRGRRPERRGAEGEGRCLRPAGGRDDHQLEGMDRQQRDLHPHR